MYQLLWDRGCCFKETFRFKFAKLNNHEITLEMVILLCTIITRGSSCKTVA